MTKLFHAPSPKGSNFAGLYLTEAGDLVDRRGARWGKSSLAFDSMPESGIVDGPRLSERSPNISGDDEGHEHIRSFLETSGLTAEQIAHVLGLIRKLPNPAGDPGRDSARNLGMDARPRTRDLDDFGAGRVRISDFG